MFLHAALGGLISVASGESFTSGAIAGGVAEGLTPVANEILSQHVSEYFNANDLSEQGSQAKMTTAQIIGLLSAAMAGGNPGTGSLIGGAGEKYNSQGHYDDDDSDGAMASDASGAAEELKDELDVFNDHASNGGVDLLSPIPGNGLPIVGGTGGSGSGAKGTLTPKDFPEVAGKISQKQLRHIAGRPELEARGGGGYLNSVDDAQRVLDAYRIGNVTILGKNAQGFPIVKFEGVTGTNVNAGVGIAGQPTNIFIIKGTKSPSIVPTNPNWSKK